MKGTIVSQLVASLVTRARQGDELAWGELVRSHSARMRRVAAGFRLDSEQAADAAQSTWLLLFQNIAKVREPEKVGGWLLVTMRRECLRLVTWRGRELPRGEWGPTELGSHH